MGDIDIAWCPGCGNFGILDVLKDALADLSIAPENLVMVSGIGQAAKIPHYLRANFFNGLHGRALPPATGIKASNPGLTVIAESGDGDMYGEGGNHFIHAIRRNPDITNLIHNNMVYGLTKGQASPTSQPGFKTPVQVHGVSSAPFNPVAVSIALDVSFVARVFIGDKESTREVIKKAISHKGFSVVDILQPCVSFNKINTYKWFSDNTYYLEDTHDRSDRQEAFRRATEQGKMALGIFYLNPERKIFDDSLSVYEKDQRPLFMRRLDTGKLDRLISSMK
ncbi:MAG: 2-oxoacid ferredoxin oxidoreductase [Nitrospirota bacterium]|nr:MAG: 2-oxoacid ferredoxin oxidoreductase [Nitrospirota bacterium]